MAQKRVWIFASNTFEVQTRGNHVRALKLFKDFAAKLKASSLTDEEIAKIFVHFWPICDAYEKMYAQRDLVSGTYKGYTLNFEQEIAKLPEQLRIWEGKVHYLYPEGSMIDTILFPRRRTPFLQGTYDDRISAVLTLSTALLNYKELSSVQASVQTYYNVLSASRDTQQQKEGTNDSLSSLLEEQRKLTAQEMFGCYGLLAFRYRYTPDRITDFVDTELLRYTPNNEDIVYFRGKVQSIAGIPIVGAMIYLPEIGAETQSDAKGEFELEVETGIWRVEVRAENYQTHVQTKVSFNTNVRTNVTLAASHLA